MIERQIRDREVADSSPVLCVVESRLGQSVEHICLCRESARFSTGQKAAML